MDSIMILVALMSLLSIAIAQFQRVDAQIVQDRLASYSNNGARSLGSNDNGAISMLFMAVPGIPGQDYPIFSEVPVTSFSCDGRVEGGFFADALSRCQPFHICANDGDGLKKFSFLCPNGTLFSQEYFICDWWFNVDCTKAENLYKLNDAIAAERGNGQYNQRQQQDQKRPSPVSASNKNMQEIITTGKAVASKIPPIPTSLSNPEEVDFDTTLRPTEGLKGLRNRDNSPNGAKGNRKTLVFNPQKETTEIPFANQDFTHEEPLKTSKPSGKNGDRQAQNLQPQPLSRNPSVSGVRPVGTSGPSSLNPGQTQPHPIPKRKDQNGGARKESASDSKPTLGSGFGTRLKVKVKTSPALKGHPGSEETTLFSPTATPQIADSKNDGNGFTNVKRPLPATQVGNFEDDDQSIGNVGEKESSKPTLLYGVPKGQVDLAVSSVSGELHPGNEKSTSMSKDSSVPSKSKVSISGERAANPSRPSRPNSPLPIRGVLQIPDTPGSDVYKQPLETKSEILPQEDRGLREPNQLKPATPQPVMNEHHVSPGLEFSKLGVLSESRGLHSESPLETVESLHQPLATTSLPEPLSATIKYGDRPLIEDEIESVTPTTTSRIVEFNIANSSHLPENGIDNERPKPGPNSPLDLQVEKNVYSQGQNNSTPTTPSTVSTISTIFPRQKPSVPVGQDDSALEEISQNIEHSPLLGLLGEHNFGRPSFKPDLSPTQDVGSQNKHLPKPTPNGSADKTRESRPLNNSQSDFEVNKDTLSSDQSKSSHDPGGKINFHGQYGEQSNPYLKDLPQSDDSENFQPSFLGNNQQFHSNSKVIPSTDGRLPERPEGVPSTDDRLPVTVLENSHPLDFDSNRAPATYGSSPAASKPSLYESNHQLGSINNSTFGIPRTNDLASIRAGPSFSSYGSPQQSQIGDFNLVQQNYLSFPTPGSVVSDNLSNGAVYNSFEPVKPQGVQQEKQVHGRNNWIPILTTSVKTDPARNVQTSNSPTSASLQAGLISLEEYGAPQAEPLSFQGLPSDGYGAPQADPISYQSAPSDGYGAPAAPVVTNPSVYNTGNRGPPPVPSRYNTQSSRGRPSRNKRKGFSFRGLYRG